MKLSEEFVNCPRICKFSFDNLFFWPYIFAFRNGILLPKLLWEKIVLVIKKNYHSWEKSTRIKLKADNNATKYLPFCQSDDAKKVADIIVSRLLSLWLNLWDFYRHEWYIVVLQRSPNPWKSKKKKKIFYFPFRLLTSTRYQIYNVLLSAYVWTRNI